ncbi:MAG: DUF655 domain-containing protein [Methanosarcinaceae archaeon]|nr:DUF655 domain-containing protein [Methanosarcinaceae archaeon]
MKADRSQTGTSYSGRSNYGKYSSGRRQTGKRYPDKESRSSRRSGGNAGEREEYVWVLDYLPYGKSVDNRPLLQKKPLVQAVGDKKFTLMELVPKEGVVPDIQARVYIGSGNRDIIDHVKQRIAYKDLTYGANLELPFILEACVRHQEERFVKFFNEAHPITTRLHMLDLLPGIGKKLMWAIIDERKKGKFTSFEEIRKRIPALYDPAKLIVNRIEEELKDDFIKYRLFTTPLRSQRRR